MAYQDDFRNKVIAALKKKNLAIDLSDEQTQEAIIQETQIVAQSESQAISPEEMRAIIQDVARQVKTEFDQETFKAQSNNFRAFDQQTIEGELDSGQGSYSGGGIASSVANKDIIIIPSNGGLGAAGTATSVNSISQIDFKHIANPNAYASFDPKEVKASLFNWAERISGVTFDTPVLGIGGAWGGVSYAPTAQWGVGNSQGSGIGGSINQLSGFGQIIFFKPATSTIYSSLFNDVAISNDFASRYISIIGYQSAVPGVFPTAGFAISFGGIGGSGPLAISGAANAAQSNRVRFLSPLTILNSTVTDTLTLGLSSTGIATTHWFVGGNGQTSNAYVLSTQSPTFNLGDMFFSGGTGHTTLRKLDVGGNGNYLTVSGGVPTWTASIGANAVNVNAAAGSTLMFPVFVNASGNQVGIALSSDVNYFVDPSTNTFYAGSAISSSTYTGTSNIAIKPGANSTTAIQLDNFGGQPILNVDTSNGRVSIGNNVSVPNYTLDVAGDTNIGNGNVFRINTSQVLSSTQVFGLSVTSDTITTGKWSGTAITTNYGGTGYATYSVGDILYASTTSFLSKLAVGTAVQILGSNGTNPSWVNLSSTTVGAAVAATTLSLQVANTGTVYPVLSPQSTAGSGVGLSVDSGLSFTPSDNALYAAIFSGTALTGTLGTANQPRVTGLGTIDTGIWNATAIGTTYGGTGSNLGSASGNAFKIPVLGAAANGYAATLIDGANSGYLLMANSNSSAPTFVNSTSASFTFSGTLNVGTAAITNGTVTGTPTSANDIVNKSYADSISGGLDVHGSARLTTIAAIGGSYRQAGTAGTLAGVGDYIISTTANTLIVSESNWDTVGIALTNGQRVLVKDGVTGGYASGAGVYGAYPTTYGGIAASWVANGIYSVASYGGAGTSGWLLVRATDTDNQAGVQELTGGTFLFVEEGSTYADHAFVCTNDTTSFGPIGFGSTQISWSLFAGGNTLIAGQGLVESGNNLALLFNLVQSNTVNSNLSRGFILGGTRAASLGSSSLVSFTVSGDSNTIASTTTLTSSGDGWTLAGGRTSRTFTFTGSDSTFTGNADGFSLSGGSSTARTLTVIGGPVTVANGIFNGAGFGLTLGSPGNLSLNNNTLSISASTSNITFTPSSTTATTHNLVSSGSAQYQLSSADTNFTKGDFYYNAGSSFAAMTRLAFGTGTGTSVLVRNGTDPVWGRIDLATANMVVGVLGISNGGTNSSATATQGGVAYGSGSALLFTSAGTAGQAFLSNGTSAPTFGTLTLAGGGTSNAGAGAANTYQFAQYNSVGSGISGFNLPTVSNSVLISATPITPSWSNGPLGVNYGGTGNSANLVARGVAYATPAGTALTTDVSFAFTPGTGLTITGNNTFVNVGSSGNYYIAGAAVVSSFAGINGPVGIQMASSSGGTSYLSTSGSNLVLNYPGTGITGGGAQYQVAFYNAAREISGSNAFTWNSANSGNGLSITSAGFGLSINNTSTTATPLFVSGANTSGNLIEAKVSTTTEFSVRFDGFTTAGGGLTVQIGKTTLAIPVAGYASLNLPSSAATNPSSPAIGDLWFNGTNLYFRKDGVTSQDLLIGSVSGSGTANKIVKWNSSTSLTDSNITDAGTGMTITATSAVGVGLGSTAYLTIKSLSGDEVAGVKNSSYFVRGIDSSNARMFSVDVAGNLRATTKSFDIPHPTKEGARLVYGVLEGPEHGVYHRGTVEGKGIIQINLPNYWHKLVGDQYTIQLTPWGNYNVCIESKTENYFTIQLVGDLISRKFKNIKVDYIVHGSRLDAPLETEQ